MKRLAVALIAAGLLSGCAFSQQSVNLAPKVEVPASDVGKGVSVALRVVDERPSKSLGNRGGGFGKGAEITSTQDVAAIVQQQLTEGLMKKGFDVIGYGDKKTPRLSVELRLLQYSTSVGAFTGGVQIEGTLKAVAAREDNNYEQIYRSERKERVVVVPTAKTNETWINTALNDVLTQLISDAKLINFLQGASPDTAAAAP